MCPQGLVLGPVLFSLFINNLPTFLPTSVKISLYADDLAIWASSQVLSEQLPQYKLPSTDWWNGPQSGAFLSTPSNVSHFILNTRLNFNPHPIFLGVTFDRALSFKHHVLSLRKKFYSRFRAFRSIASASWGPSKESLCILYKAFICPILTYASPGWLFFSPPSHITSLERMYRSPCRVITGCLSSTPIPLLHVEALLPPLYVTLTHQSISFFERAFLLPSNFLLASLVNSNPRIRLEKG